MKRISANSIKRLVVLAAILAVAIAPQAAKAEAFFAPDGGFANITASCTYFWGIQVHTISTSAHSARQRLWGLAYENGSYSRWGLLYDWKWVRNTEDRYEPVQVKSGSRQVLLYVEVEILTVSGWQHSERYLPYANYSTDLGGPVYWCYT